MRILALALALSACGHDAVEPKEPIQDERVVELQARFDDACAEAKAMADEHGWIINGDGDAMLWSGMAAATACDLKFNPVAAEWPDQPGRFDRAWPAGSITSDKPGWCSWSRDMQKGLLWWAWRHGPAARPAIERHIAYGRKNNWLMGRPAGDGRCYYTPSAIGLTFQVAWGLGGEDDVQRLWPDVYSSGLDDYRAHIQVKNIALRGEIESSRPDDGDAHPKPDEPVVDEVGASLTGVTGTQFERLQEHAGREPKCGFYQAAHGVYTGDFGPAFTALLGGGQLCTYVRCANPRACYLADWMFSADMVLRRYK